MKQGVATSGCYYVFIVNLNLPIHIFLCIHAHNNVQFNIPDCCMKINENLLIT